MDDATLLGAVQKRGEPDLRRVNDPMGPQGCAFDHTRVDDSRWLRGGSGRLKCRTGIAEGCSIVLEQSQCIAYSGVGGGSDRRHETRSLVDIGS